MMLRICFKIIWLNPNKTKNPGDREETKGGNYIIIEAGWWVMGVCYTVVFTSLC